MGAGSAFQATAPVSSRKKHHISEETITLQKIEKKLEVAVNIEVAIYVSSGKWKVDSGSNKKQ